MQTEFRIAVADAERDSREFLSRTLTRHGHLVVAVCADGEELVQVIRDKSPDLAIADVQMPRVDGVEAALLVNRDQSVPFLLMSATYDKPSILKANARHITGYLVKPISEAGLNAAVITAMVRHDHMQALMKEANELRQSLEDRKLIEKAKGIVMKRTKIDENEAYHRIRKLASHLNVKICEICRRVLGAEDVLRSLEDI